MTTTEIIAPKSQQNKIQLLLRQVGGQNKYQYLLFFIFSIKWIVAAMILFSLNFFYYVPDFSCEKQMIYDSSDCQDFVCGIEDQQFWYNHLPQPLKSSIALDYGVIMVCSKEWLSSLLQSLSYIGSLFGYLGISHIADNYGRKRAQLISWCICIGAQILTVFSVNLYMIGVGAFFLGFGANGAINVHYSFFKELVSGKTRQRFVIGIQLAFSVGVSLISLLSYLIDDWKYTMGFCIVIPSLISAVLMHKYIEQTPQFTIKRGFADFTKSFNRIAMFNKKSGLQQAYVEQQLVGYSIPKQKESEVSYLDLFRYKSLIKIAILTGIINFSIQFIYDGTLLSLDKFGLNVYFNQMLVGLVEVFAAIFAVYMVPNVYRKRYTTIAFILVTLVCVGMGIESLTYDHVSDDLNYHTIIQMMLIAVLRFLMSSLWGVFFVFVSQLYPNQVSSLSFGWVSVTGTVGASISPYIKLATANLVMFVMAILSGLMIFLIRMLPQTKGKVIRTRIKQRQQQECKTKETYQGLSINNGSAY